LLTGIIKNENGMCNIVVPHSVSVPVIKKDAFDASVVRYNSPALYKKPFSPYAGDIISIYTMYICV